MRLDRLLSIIIILLNEDRVTARGLAERFGVTIRTIYRDLDAVQAAGIPLTAMAGNTGGYEIMPNYRLERQFLSLKDMAAILTALKGVRTTLATEEIDNAIGKVGSLVPREKRDVIDLYGEQVALDMTGWVFDERRRAMVRQLHQAVAAQKLVRFTYRNLQGVQGARTVEPMTLLYKGSAWYLFGFCRRRSDFRLFHIGRMADLETLKQAFTRRPASYRDYLERNAEPVTAVAIVLRFPRELRLKVDEFFSADCVTEEGDSLIVRVSFPEDEWVRAMILGYGDMVEVLEPPGLRARIAEMAAGMDRIYRKGGIKPDRGMSQGDGRIRRITT
jgi:predicted DNA-binding transcriptional regulator YafY